MTPKEMMDYHATMLKESGILPPYKGFDLGNALFVDSELVAFLLFYRTGYTYPMTVPWSGRVSVTVGDSHYRSAILHDPNDTIAGLSMFPVGTDKGRTVRIRYNDVHITIGQGRLARSTEVSGVLTVYHGTEGTVLRFNKTSNGAGGDYRVVPNVGVAYDIEDADPEVKTDKS